MKLSLATLLSIPALHAANAAFAEVTGGEYRNPDFEPTQETADAVAAWLDARYSEITPIGGTTPLMMTQTHESYWDECRSSSQAADAAKEVFRLVGLEIPTSWSDLA